MAAWACWRCWRCRAVRSRTITARARLALAVTTLLRGHRRRPPSGSCRHFCQQRCQKAPVRPIACSVVFLPALPAPTARCWSDRRRTATRRRVESALVAPTTRPGAIRTGRCRYPAARNAPAWRRTAAGSLVASTTTGSRATGARDLEAELNAAGVDLQPLQRLEPTWAWVQGDQIRIVGAALLPGPDFDPGPPYEPISGAPFNATWVASVPRRAAAWK